MIPVKKLLIATGLTTIGGRTKSVEVLNIQTKGGYHCDNWKDFSHNVEGATGTWLGNSAVICGGKGKSDISQYCFNMNSTSTNQIATMKVRRYNAASVLIDSDTFWITGGGYFTDRQSEMYK